MFHLIGLIETLAQPFAAAMDQEFGPRRPAPMPCEPTAPAVAVEADQSASVPEFSAIAPSAECDATRFVASATPDVATPASVISDASDPAEPLFVRLGSGKGSRYILAGGSEPGERFRRRVRGGKAVYEPATARVRR